MSDGSPRILLAGDEHTGTLASVRALRSAGYAPWLALSVPRAYGSRSRAVAGSLAVPDPGEDPDRFAEALAATATRLGAVAVLPGTELSLLALTGREAVFPNGVALGTPAKDALEQATDKAALAALGEAAGLESPPSVTIGPADLPAEAPRLAYPAIVKPARTVHRGADGGLRNFDPKRVANAAELLRVAESLPGDRWLVQPWLDGALASVSGVVWKGQMLCAAHQVASRTWPPGNGGSSFAETVARVPELEHAVARLLAALGLSGIYQLQFVLAEGRYRLIDLNPRIYGSIGLVIAAGLNLPAIWVDLLLGREPRIAGYRPGVGFRAEEDDVRALAAAFQDGKRGAALRGLLPRRRTVHAVFSWRDPAPSLRTVEKLLGRR